MSSVVGASAVSGEESAGALRIRFSWPKFVGISALLVGLKAVALGVGQDWDFMLSLQRWRQDGWAAVDWPDWIALSIILVEGLAAGAAVTLALSYVSIVNNQTIQQTINDMRTFFRPHAPALPSGATSRMTVDPNDAQLVKDMLDRAHDHRVSELGEEIAGLARQLEVLRATHRSELDARNQELDGLLTPIFDQLEAVSLRMRQLREEIERRRSGP